MSWMAAISVVFVAVMNIFQQEFQGVHKVDALSQTVVTLLDGSDTVRSG